MKAASYRQCTRCVMDTSDPEIVFDSQGRCNHCTQQLEALATRTYQGANSDLALEALMSRIKEAGRRSAYDVVIGISGGSDSVYTAWLARKHGLRALCVHMDNGWNSELAVTNIERTLKQLGYELSTEVLDWLEFRDLQLSFLRASVPEAETPTDIAILTVLYQNAARHGVRYMLSGNNYATEGILPKLWHYDHRDEKYLKAIHGQFGKIPLKTFPMFDYKTEIYYKFIRGIQITYPLNLVHYDKAAAAKLLERELGWRSYGGKHHESLYTKFVQSYLLPVKFGIDYRRITYSNQICAGTINRETALADLERSPYDPTEIGPMLEYVGKKLGISTAELDEIVRSPAKTYRDYPNQQRMLEALYDTYRTVVRVRRAVESRLGAGRASG